MSGLGVYANYLISGKAPDLATIKPIIPDINITDLTDTISNKFKSIKKDEPVNESYLYKWRDDKGVIHYTSEKPLDVVNYESIKLSNDTNVVPAVPESEITDERVVQQQAAKLPSTDLPANVYSPEGIEHIFNQAKDIQSLVNDQFNYTEKISNQE
jgi:uncharacterized protein DUF4124